MYRQTIFVTGGDPWGIGAESFRLALERLSQDERQSFPVYSADRKPLSIVFFGCEFSLPAEKLRPLVEKMGFKHFVRLHNPESFKSNLKRCYARGESFFIFYDLEEERETMIRIGCPWKDLENTPVAMGGYFAIRALALACRMIHHFPCAGLLTLPLSKARVCRAISLIQTRQPDFLKKELGLQSDFVDHTQYFAASFSCATWMLMLGNRLSVFLMTSHLQLRFVPDNLAAVLNKECLFSAFEQICTEFSEELPPPWALCGLNPHAGEDGFLGNEEQQWLIPWKEKMKKTFPSKKIEGPYAADALFSSQQRENYRLIIANYHDQGLIPFKALEGMRGINCTLGLPFLRTSPAHGTAFAIPKSEIKCESTMQALKILLARFRKEMKN